MKNTTIDRIMAQHIRLPGCPQIVVTRGFAYNWLKDTGMNPSRRGFGSIDYLVHAPTALDAPLTDLDSVADFLAGVKEHILGISDEVTA